MWLEHLEVVMCDFVGKEGVVFEQVEEWKSEDNVFLSKDRVHNEVLVVLDNTGWLQQFSNGIPKEHYMDVTYEMKIETHFEANDMYNKTFMFFMIMLGVLTALILLMACCYRS